MPRKEYETCDYCFRFLGLIKSVDHTRRKHTWFLLFKPRSLFFFFNNPNNNLTSFFSFFSAASYAAGKESSSSLFFYEKKNLNLLFFPSIRTPYSFTLQIEISPEKAL